MTTRSSNTMLRLGIDVGGTNTDAVLMRGAEVLVSAKRFTSADVTSGVLEAVDHVLSEWGGDRREISAAMVGTTQFVNAFIQRQGLARVAAIRIALPSGDGVPPMVGWPEDLVQALGRHAYMIGGGAFYTGEEYAELDEAALAAAAADAVSKGVGSFAVTATFAPMRPDIEHRARDIILQAHPAAMVTLSSEVGGLGLIDRENATIINASLSELSARVIASLVDAFRRLEIHAPVFISQNDGTLVSTATAARYPILTCSAGPTNSLRGAAFLTGLDEAIVVDVGGTTSDVGFLQGGFPRETTAATFIGGVRTNFRMPDVLSIGLGGGSIVRTGPDGAVEVGPTSVGFRLQTEALVFGGDTLTATDVAVKRSGLAIGDPARVAGLSAEQVEAVDDRIHAAIEEAIDQIKTSARPLPLILVGGGSIIISRNIRGASEVHRPRHAEVANAVGAAIALASGRVDKLYDFGRLGRDEALALARSEAIAAAVGAGAARDLVEIVDVSELPMTHMRTGCVQVRVRAVGPLAALAERNLSAAE